MVTQLYICNHYPYIPGSYTTLVHPIADPETFITAAQAFSIPIISRISSSQDARYISKQLKFPLKRNYQPIPRLAANSRLIIINPQHCYTVLVMPND